MWKDKTLNNPPPSSAAFESGTHLVHFYEHRSVLIENVCDYIVPGLARGEGCILIVTGLHRKLLLEAFEGRAIDVAKARARGQLEILDAMSLLRRCVVNGVPVKEKFFDLLCPLLESMEYHYPAVKAYGEIVNILWHQDNLVGAIRLERMLSELLARYHFTLMCGYGLEKDEWHKKGVWLGDICSCHSHSVTADGAVNELVT